MLPKPSLSSLSALMDRVIELSRLSSVFEFESFEALPCGCVAGAYRAAPFAVSLVRLEAKGPHCVRFEHSEDQVLDVELDENEYDVEGYASEE